MGRSKSLVGVANSRAPFRARPPEIDVRGLENKARKLGMKVYTFAGETQTLKFRLSDLLMLSADPVSTYDAAADIVTEAAELAFRAVVEGSERLSQIEATGDRIDRLNRENAESLDQLLGNVVQ
jgi:hypothetical protein